MITFFEDIKVIRWRLYHDALGRLTRVDEGRTQVPVDPPLAGGSFYVTTYAYDVLDRLTAVNKRQDGGASGQIRFFEYDGLGRLTAAELPEYNQLAMTYEYDDQGNVTAKNLDEGGYAETLSYDKFNRLKMAKSRLYWLQSHSCRSVFSPPGWNRIARGKRSAAPGEVERSGGSPVRAIQLSTAGIPRPNRSENNEGNRMDYSAPAGLLHCPVTPYPGRCCACPGLSYTGPAGLSAPDGFYGLSTFLSGRLARDKVTYPESHGGVTVERFYTYDWRGLPVRKAEVFGGGGASPRTFTTVYGDYDLAGNARTVVYPSGQTVTRDYTQGGGLASVGDGVTTLYDNLAWAAHGAPFKLSLHDAAGDGRIVNWVQTFNNRLWPAQIKTGPGVTENTPITATTVLLGLNYTGYEANGDITGVTRYLRHQYNATLSTLPFTYTYDNLNRLWKTEFPLGAVTNKYTFSMDEFGNVTAQTRTEGSSPAPGSHTMLTDRQTNRLNATGVSYDELGNLRKTDAFDYKLFYQDQGHVLDMKNAAGSSLLYRYFYDAEGKRRIKAQATGGAIDLSDDCSFFFYEGEELICQQDLGNQDQGDPFYEPKFLLLDHLGTTRAEMTFAGSAASISNHYDTMPYGEQITPPSPLTEKQLFTGKQHDAESSLNYFGARYASENSCRFTSVDRIGGSPLNPKSLNRYQYCHNSPVQFLDHSGRVPIPVIVALGGGIVKAEYNAIIAYKSDQSVMGKSWGTIGYEAFKGFIGGFAGTLAAVGAATLPTAKLNPATIGALGGAVENGVEQAMDYRIKGETPSAYEALCEVFAGACMGAVAHTWSYRLPYDFPPKMWKSRPLFDYRTSVNVRTLTIMETLKESNNVLWSNQMARELEFKNKSFSLHVLTDLFGERWKEEAEAGMDVGVVTTSISFPSSPPEETK